MRDGDQNGVMTLGFVALTATAVFLLRMGARAQRRRLMRDDAMRTLRESGEFFFGRTG